MQASLYWLIVTWMLSLQPIQQAPWGARFGEVANAIDVASQENPIFGTPARTAAVLTSVAFFESHFDPAALGDCRKGVPKSLATCQSIGAFQISKAHAPSSVLSDPLPAARAALRLMATSQRVCARRPLSAALGWYASGGATCGGIVKSGHRMALSGKLLRDHPPAELATP